MSKSYEFSAKIVHKSYLSWHWRMMQSLRKNWLVISNMTWVIWGIFTQPFKSLKITLTWALFVHKVYRVWAKKYRGVIFHDTEQWCKIWINPDLVVSKMAWGIGLTFIRALKSLKNCTLTGSFCPKHIMFQVENFIGIMCHDTEEW